MKKRSYIIGTVKMYKGMSLLKMNANKIDLAEYERLRWFGIAYKLFYIYYILIEIHECTSVNYIVVIKIKRSFIFVNCFRTSRGMAELLVYFSSQLKFCSKNSVRRTYN